MSVIEYNQTVGIFSADGFSRLDIGTDATKMLVPADHESWATRLVLRRLDGPSLGEVSDEHLVGIFSEDGKVRLDIGTDAMKTVVPADHESWATRLAIRRLDGATAPDQHVHYGDVVGIFSEDGQCRLDIGTDAMKKLVSADHESWATFLRIQDPDSIKNVTLKSIEYDFDNAKIISSSPIEVSLHKSVTNDSDIEQESSITQECSSSYTSSWSDQSQITLSAETEFNAKIPLVANGKVSLSATISEQVTLGKTIESTHSWSQTTTVRTPPHTTVDCFMSATQSKLEVPYTLHWEFVHQSGHRIPGTTNGTFKGVSSNDFITVFDQTNLQSLTTKRVTHPLDISL